jgi:hypothetical protein
MARPPKNYNMDKTELPAELQQQVIERHQQAAAQQGAIQQDIGRAALMNQRLGKRSVLSAVQKFLTAVDLTDLAEIKASKDYKGFVYLRPDGTTLTIGTWEEYCVNVEGRSVQGIDDYLASYKAFGEELYDAMQAVGLGPSKMRSLRQLPEEQQAQLETLKSLDDKDEIVELVDALLDKQRSKITEREAVIEEQAQTITAKDAVAATNHKTIDDLQTQLQRAAQESPDEVDEDLREQASKRAWSVETGLRGQLRPVLQALKDNAEASGIDVSACIAGHLNQIDLALADLRRELDVMAGPSPEIDFDWSDVPPPVSSKL